LSSFSLLTPTASSHFIYRFWGTNQIVKPFSRLRNEGGAAKGNICHAAHRKAYLLFLPLTF